MINDKSELFIFSVHFECSFELLIFAVHFFSVHSTRWVEGLNRFSQSTHKRFPVSMISSSNRWFES